MTLSNGRVAEEEAVRVRASSFPFDTRVALDRAWALCNGMGFLLRRPLRIRPLCASYLSPGEDLPHLPRLFPIQFFPFLGRNLLTPVILLFPPPHSHQRRVDLGTARSWSEKRIILPECVFTDRVWQGQIC